jgi:hypothetical protein
MLQRIRSLAVTELHTAVHTVILHVAKQQAEEPTASCDLVKLCPCGSNAEVALARLRSRVLSAAYMKSVKDIAQLVFLPQNHDFVGQLSGDDLTSSSDLYH